MKNELIEGRHYYYNEEGFIVLTEVFHLEKGFCCGNGCKHCPYNYVNVPEPRRRELLLKKQTPDSGKESAPCLKEGSK